MTVETAVNGRPQIALEHESFLRPNGLGGYIVSVSQLGAWARCNLQKHYYDVANADPNAPQPENLSATEYGKVVHYALMILEKLRHEGDPDALPKALATFEHYWHPANLPLIASPITQWLPRQTFGGLRDRGREVITAYAKLLERDESKLLGLEYRFSIPLQVGDVTHTLSGVIDRLCIRKHYTKPYVSLDDFKTGKQKTYLRWDMQGTAYAYATTTPEFWAGWEHAHRDDLQPFEHDTIAAIQDYFGSYGYRLVVMPDDTWRYSRLGLDEVPPLAARRFNWINMQEVKFANGGWRNDRDYARLALAVDGYIRQNEAGAYGLTLTGEVCEFCAFNKTCGGTGLPDIEDGRP